MRQIETPSNIILIEGEAAKKFLEEARHPDPEMLQKRDAMFKEWDMLFSDISSAEVTRNSQVVL